MTTKDSISGSVVLITGANRGIGKAFVEAFLKAGAAKVYAAVRTLSTAEALVAAHGGRVVPIELDVTRPETVTAAAKRAADVTIVVNNAGILLHAAPLDVGAFATLAEEMEVNVYGLMRVAQAFAPVLKANGGGIFAQLNSVASLRNFAGFTTYAVSKAAAYSFTQGLRDVLAEQGTTVVSVHPGPIATDMADQAGFLEIAEPPSLVADDLIAAIREGRFHSFPDTMARNFWSAYEPFAKAVVEPQTNEG